MSNRRASPSLPDAVLPLLAASFVSLVVAGALMAGYRSLEQFCLDALHFAAARVPLFPWIVLLIPATVVALALESAIRQLLATNRLVHALLEDEVAPTDEPLWRTAVRAGIDGRIRLIASSDFFAFCFGCLRPAICISTAAVAELTAGELEAVLRHESWHVRRRDPLRVLVANAFGSALFILPVARELTRHYILKIELRADHAAVRAMGDAHPLAAALYRATTRTSALSLQPAVGAFNSTNARIDQLLGDELPTFAPPARVIGLSLIVSAGVLLLLCLSVMAMSVGDMFACIRS